MRARSGSIPSTIAQGSEDPNPGDSLDSIGKQSVEKRRHSGYSSKQRADHRAQGSEDPNRHATVYNGPLHTAVAKAQCPESALNKEHVLIKEQTTTLRSEDLGLVDPDRNHVIVGNGPLHTVIAKAKCPNTAQHESALTEEQIID